VPETERPEHDLIGHVPPEAPPKGSGGKDAGSAPASPEPAPEAPPKRKG
jgi:hypothetical protein